MLNNLATELFRNLRKVAGDLEFITTRDKK